MRKVVSAAIALFIVTIAPTAHAQWAVVDVGAITQLVKEVATLEQQLATARNQLSQAQSEYQSMTGGRGMEQLLAGTERNYLPPDWPTLNAALTGGGTAYGPFGRGVTTQIAANAVLTPRQVAVLSPAEREKLSAARQNAALLTVVTQQALAATSTRFASLQQLIGTIGRAQDQKAALDLQARIGAEQTMLQNESTKLQVLYQLAQAQEWSRRQRTREQAVADIGSVRGLPPVGLLH
jgi:type IV secretion system protein VirB5